MPGQGVPVIRGRGADDINAIVVECFSHVFDELRLAPLLFGNLFCAVIAHLFVDINDVKDFGSL